MLALTSLRLVASTLGAPVNAGITAAARSISSAVRSPGSAETGATRLAAMMRTLPGSSDVQANG